MSLSIGAAGIVFPHIDTPEEAALAVSKCRYACSGGDRSLSPSALIAGITDIAPDGLSHTHVADRNIAIICQIESPVSNDFKFLHQRDSFQICTPFSKKKNYAL